MLDCTCAAISDPLMKQFMFQKHALTSMSLLHHSLTSRASGGVEKTCMTAANRASCADLESGWCCVVSQPVMTG